MFNKFAMITGNIEAIQISNKKQKQQKISDFFLM